MKRLQIVATAATLAAALGVGAAYGGQTGTSDPPSPAQPTQSHNAMGGGMMMSDADMADMKETMADMKRMMEHCNRMMDRMQSERAASRSGKPDNH